MKITNPLTKKNNYGKQNTNYLEEYFNIESRLKAPLTQTMLMQLGPDLLHYAKTSKKLRLEWFFIDKGILPHTARAWTKKFPDFEVYYEAAKAIIGLRREEGALSHTVNPATIHQTLHLYDYDWKTVHDEKHSRKLEELTYKAKLDKEETERNVTVIMRPLKALEAPTPEEVALQASKAMHKKSRDVTQERLNDK